MPIYMDVHIVPGVKAKDVAEAHRKDLLQQLLGYRFHWRYQILNELNSSGS